MINFLVFQIAWFVAILGAAWDLVIPAMGLMLVLTWFNLSRLQNIPQNLKLILCAILIGLAIDSFAITLQLITFKSLSWWPTVVAPVWMLSLWGIFATTLNGYLSWINHYPWTAAIASALAGPLAYLGGEQLGAISLSPGWHSLTYFAIAWAVAVFTLIQLNRNLLSEK